MRSVFMFEGTDNSGRIERAELDLPCIVPNGSRMTHKWSGTSHVVYGHEIEVDVKGNVTVFYKTHLVPSE